MKFIPFDLFLTVYQLFYSAKYHILTGCWLSENFVIMKPKLSIVYLDFNFGIAKTIDKEVIQCHLKMCTFDFLVPSK